jgi:cell division protein FtsN
MLNNSDIVTPEPENATKPLVKKESGNSEFATIPGTGKYYIVAGCFVMESNADNMVKSLNNKGYKSEKFTKIKELYFVSIASFSDKATADRELRIIHSKGFPDCWIKKY